MRTGWLRRTAAALAGALALAVVSGMGPSAQEASAAPYQSKLCWTVMEDGRLKVYCVDIQVKWPWEKYFECWMCGLGIDWLHDPVIREDFEGLVGRHVTQGLATLGLAEFEADARKRDALRGQAMAQFDAATRYAGESRMRLGATYEADPERHTVDPSPDPWAEAAGIDVADGITLLQAAIADPRDAARLRALATAQFDEAYQELSLQKAIG
jgi:hypothetical protein